MKIRYFEDTDTALVEFSAREVTETREISGNVYVDLDAGGNLVSMTIEHARENANLREVAFEQMARKIGLIGARSKGFAPGLDRLRRDRLA